MGQRTRVGKTSGFVCTVGLLIVGFKWLRSTTVAAKNMVTKENRIYIYKSFIESGERTVPLSLELQSD